MAKDTKDTTTPDLLPMPKRRGRPPTGAAKSNAQRQEEHRKKTGNQILTLEAEVKRLRELLNAQGITY